MSKTACVFDHIQKTAGTSWTKFATAGLGAGRVAPLILHEDIRFTEGLTDRWAMVSGHFDLSPRYHWPAAIYHMTILREPVDRFLSHFFYVREMKSATEPFGVLAKGWGLDEAVAAGHPVLERHVRDFYMRHFLAGMHGPAVVDGLLATGGHSPERVADFVEERYDLIGMTEHLDLTTALFGLDLGWMTGAGGGVPRERVTRARPRVEDLAPGTRAALRRMAEGDRELYERLRTGFFRRVRGAMGAGGLVAGAAIAGGSRVRGEALNQDGGSGLVAGAAVAGGSGRGAAVCGGVSGENGGSAGDERCRLEGMDIFSPSAAANDRVWAGSGCVLSAVFRVADPGAQVGVYITIRNQLRQVAFRTVASAMVTGGETEARVEVKWRFRCALGPGTYDCDLQVDLLDEVGGVRHSGHMLSAYQFEVLAPLGAYSAGAVWLEPETSCVCGPSAPPVLAGEVVVPRRRIATRPGARLRIPVSLRNAGGAIWSSTGFNRAGAGVSITPAGMPSRFDMGSRHALPHDLAPGEQVDLHLEVEAPAQAGEHAVWIGLVQERVSWFCVDAEGIQLVVMPEATGVAA